MMDLAAMALGGAEYEPREQSSPRKLLIVEDDLPLADLLEWHFDREGFEIRTTANGIEALALAAQTPPDLILLDCMLESLSGIEVCRRLRAEPATASVPIIMVTALDQEKDRVKGLETGADDYVTKPFSPRELVARAHAVLRRARPTRGGAMMSYADLEMDAANYKVRRSGEPVKLGPTEFRLLKYLMDRPGRVVSRDMLITHVWDRAEVDSRTVDVHVRRLRKALNAGGRRDLIRTVRSAGYALDHEN